MVEHQAASIMVIFVWASGVCKISISTDFVVDYARVSCFDDFIFITCTWVESYEKLNFCS